MVILFSIFIMPRYMGSCPVLYFVFSAPIRQVALEPQWLPLRLRIPPARFSATRARHSTWYGLSPGLVRSCLSAGESRGLAYPVMVAFRLVGSSLSYNHLGKFGHATNRPNCCVRSKNSQSSSWSVWGQNNWQSDSPTLRTTGAGLLTRLPHHGSWT